MSKITSKQEEREVLFRIKEIIEALGEESYVATAMSGVLELAAQNIDDDAGYNFPEKIAFLEKSSDDAERIALLKQNQLDLANKKIAQYSEELKQVKEELITAKDGLCEASDKNDSLIGELDRMKNEKQERAYENMKLKARLYDLLDKMGEFDIS